MGFQALLRPCGVCILLPPCLYTLLSRAGLREHSATLYFRVHQQSLRLLLCRSDAQYFRFLSIHFQYSCQLAASTSLSFSSALAAISSEGSFVRPGRIDLVLLPHWTCQSRRIYCSVRQIAWKTLCVPICHTASRAHQACGLVNSFLKMLKGLSSLIK